MFVDGMTKLGTRGRCRILKTTFNVTHVTKNVWPKSNKMFAEYFGEGSETYKYSVYQGLRQSYIDYGDIGF